MSRASYLAPAARVVAGLLVVASPGAFAGSFSVAGSITYAPLNASAATAVPTLSEWGLVALVLLLVVVAYRVLRNQLGGKPLASVVLAGFLGLGMASGLSTLRPALAAVEVPISLTEAPGGLAGFVFTDRSGALITVTNNSGVPQKITGREVDGSYTFDDGDSNTPQCTVGLVLPTTAVCYLAVKYAAG